MKNLTNGPRILLIDIETAPNTVLAWGLFNQNIAIQQIVDSGLTLCFAAKWLGERDIIFSSIYQDGAKKMLKKAHALLDQADMVVHYNGKSFDIPTLQKDFIKIGLRPPSPVKHIDLLQVARDQFKFVSNKLDFITNYLGLGSKVRHKGMELWVQCMADDEVAWGKMERYNKQDVRLLERLYKKFRPWIKHHPNMGLYIDDSKGRPVCRNCGSPKLHTRGEAMTEAGKYRRYQCQACGTWGRGNKNLLTKEERVKLHRIIK